MRSSSAHARIDGLTGLLNRPGFDAVAAETFAETLRSGQPVSALMCDIDAFRGLNERYGHEAGDRALKNLAEVLDESMDAVSGYWDDMAETNLQSYCRALASRMP